MTERREISGNDTGSPVVVRHAGCLYVVGVLSTLLAIGILACVADELSTSNELKKKEINIQQQRLDIAKRQYTLDSLKFYSDGKKR